MTKRPKSLTEAFPDIMKKVEAKEKLLEQRRKELREKDITAETRIVAWIDILGFSHELLLAKTKTQHRAVYQKMLFVHEAFDSPTASDDPEECQEINEDYGRSVQALSDGLVVTASANAKARSVMTPYDFFMSFIDDIIMAQTNCAVKGIFVRGGISIGPFYHDNNILLSPALVRAYKMEAERATYPVIIIEPDHVNALRQLKGFKNYSKDFEPSQTYFRPFKSPAQRKGERFLHLDYLNYLSDPGNHGFFRDEDRLNWADREKFSPQERDHLYSLSHVKSAVRAMTRHKEHLVKNYEATNSERVRAKFRWLMKYQNRALKGYGPLYDAACIDLQKFKVAS